MSINLIHEDTKEQKPKRKAKIPNFKYGTISKILPKIMEMHRINSTELSRTSSIPAPTINNIIYGNIISPTISVAVPLANHLGITVGQLVGNEEISSRHPIVHAPLIISNKIEFDSSNNIINTSNNTYPVASALNPILAFKLTQDYKFPFKQGNIIIVSSNPYKHLDIVLVIQNNNISLQTIIIEGSNVLFKTLITKQFEQITDHKIIGPVVQIVFN